MKIGLQKHMKKYICLSTVAAIFLFAVVFLAPFTANAASSPSGILTFVSPSAGEQIVVGKPYNIKWTGPVRWITSPGTTEAIKNVKLTMTCGDPSKGAPRDTVITPSTKNDGLFQWSVPKNLSANNYCKITIASTNGKYYDVSPIFGIVTTTPPPAPTLNVSCSASPNPANTNQSVTFASTVSGGTGVYSYSWSGGCTSTNANCGNTFQNAGTYNESLTVNSGSQSKSATCSVAINAVVGGITVSKNSAFADQNISPNSVNVKIGSYVIQNPTASTESMRLTSLKVGLNLNGMTLTNLRTSDVSGSPIGIPSATNNFSINDTLTPGTSMILDIFADIGTSTSGTVQTTLQATYIGTADGIANISQTVSGQTMTLSSGTIAPPTLVLSSTTPSQYIAVGSNGLQNATQATYNFVSTGGTSIINELRFTISGSNTVSSIAVGNVTATPINGVADLFFQTGLSVPSGAGGLTQNVLVSYSGVGTGELTSGITSSIALTYVKYTSSGMAIIMNPAPNVSAPTMTLVGSEPIVTVPSIVNSGLVLGGQNQIGQAVITANPQGAIKVGQISFSMQDNGFDNPTITGTPYLSIGGTPVTGSSCTAYGFDNIICTLGNGYSSGFVIPAGQTQTFSLYTQVNGTAQAGATPSISTSLWSPSNFYWDDTATNGASGTGLTGELIYNFPTNSYTIHQ